MDLRFLPTTIFCDCPTQCVGTDSLNAALEQQKVSGSRLHLSS